MSLRIGEPFLRSADDSTTSLGIPMPHEPFNRFSSPSLSVSGSGRRSLGKSSITVGSRTLCSLIHSASRTEAIAPSGVTNTTYKVKINQKTVKYTPVDKLQDAFILLLTGAHRRVEIHTRLRADPVLCQALGKTECAEQSVVQDTLDACTDENVEQMQQAVNAIFAQHSRASHHDYQAQWQLPRHRPLRTRVRSERRGTVSPERAATAGHGEG